MIEEEFYNYINKNLGNVNGGRVYVKEICIPLPLPQSGNPFTGRLSRDFWHTQHLEVGLLTPFGETIPMGKGDSFDLCLKDLKANYPNLP